MTPEAEVQPAAAHKAPAHGPHRIQVGDDKLHFREVLLQERAPTALQILECAKLHPADEYLLFRVLRSGLLEELRPEQRTDLADHQLERFLAFRSDRTFRFHVNGRTFDWGVTFISGHTLKVLAGVDPESHDVWLKVAGGEDRLIEDCELFDLSAPGIEHFVTTRRTFKIIVNGREKSVDKSELSFVEVVRLAFPDAIFNEKTVYTVLYTNGPRRNPEGGMTEGQSVFIKNRMVFNVSHSDKS